MTETKGLEVWVGVDGLENYAVSSSGRIVNVNTGRTLSPSIDKWGNKRVVLFRNGVRYYVYVHRLVAFAFFKDYEKGIQIVHINDDNGDNRIENLKFGTGCRTSEGTIV